MELFLVPGAVMDDTNYLNNPNPVPSLDTIEEEHLECIAKMGVGTSYPFIGVGMPSRSRMALLVPSRVRYDYFSNSNNSNNLYSKINCGSYDGIVTPSGFEMFEYPGHVSNFKGMMACLLLLDYTDVELYDCLSKGSFAGNKQTPITVHCADSTQTIGYQLPVNMIGGTAPHPTQVVQLRSDWFTGTKEIAADIFLGARNKQLHGSQNLLTQSIGDYRNIWYAVSRGDGTVLDTYYLDLKKKQIQLLTSYVDETVLTLSLCSQDEAIKDQDYYFNPGEAYNCVPCEFKPDYHVYDIENPASLGTICRAAEELIEARSKALYSPKEQVTQAYQKALKHLVMGTQAAQAAYGVNRVSNGSGSGGSNGTYQYTFDPSNISPLTPLQTRLFYKYNIRMVENDYQNPLRDPQ